MSDHEWITGPAQIADLAQRLTTAPWVALDSESNSAHVYQEQVCLLQFNVAGYLALIDPLALEDAPTALAPLAPALADPQQRLWLHGGEYDVICLKRDFGWALHGVFDTQQAASFLGWPKTNYGAVVEACCAVSLAKGHSQYDWGQRPIDDSARAYALDDVRYLPLVGAHLAEAIAAADLVEEFTIACRAVEDAEARSTDFDPANMWRIKGSQRLPPQAWPMLCALFVWRDAQASERNVPPGRIINNEALLALARQAPTNFQQLKRLRFKSWFLHELGEQLIACIQAAKHQPPTVPERPRRREVDPLEEERERRLKNWRQGEAERRRLPLQVVLPAKSLEHLKRYGGSDLAAVPQLGEKRIARDGATLQQLCG